MNTHALMHSFISCRSLFLLLSSSNIGYENEQNSHKYHSDSDCLLRMLLQYDVCDRNKVGFNDYYFWPNFTILFRYFSCLVALCLEAFVFFSTEDCYVLITSNAKTACQMTVIIIWKNLLLKRIKCAAKILLCFHLNRICLLFPQHFEGNHKLVGTRD